MFLIGLVAEAGSGKTTIARYFKDGCGGLFPQGSRMAFAHPLKSILKHYFHIKIKDKQHYHSRWNMTTREALQRMGDGMRQWFGPDVWIKLLDSELACVERDECIIVDDVRYVNEAAYIRDMGYLIRLQCEDLEKIKESSHKSETDMNNIPEEWFYATISYKKSEGVPAMENKFHEVVKELLDTEDPFGVPF